MIRLSMSKDEWELIEDIRELVEYGEILDLKMEEEKPEEKHELHAEEVNLIRALRTQKCFTRIVIHDGLPKYGEHHGKTRGGAKYIKRDKF